MSDYLVRGMSMDGFVKVVAIRSTEMVRRGAQIQGTTPNATAESVIRIYRNGL